MLVCMSAAANVSGSSDQQDPLYTAQTAMLSLRVPVWLYIMSVATTLLYRTRN